jgi:hypothetical protein
VCKKFISSTQTNILEVNVSPKQEKIAVLASDKVDIKPKLIRSNKEGHFILIKGTMHQEEVTIVKLYAHPTLLNNCY